MCGLRNLNATARGEDCTPEAGDTTPGLWAISELQTPWNINRGEPAKRPPFLHLDQAHASVSKPQ